MVQDDIMRMAREAGLKSAVLLHIYDGREGALSDSELNELRNIERFASLIASAEREACAKVCDELADASNLVYAGRAAMHCAAAIRARNQA
jgi:hypothetical protein